MGVTEFVSVHFLFLLPLPNDYNQQLPKNHTTPSERTTDSGNRGGCSGGHWWESDER
jgi:hypothetical protein